MKTTIDWCHLIDKHWPSEANQSGEALRCHWKTAVTEKQSQPSTHHARRSALHIWCTKQKNSNAWQTNDRRLAKKNFWDGGWICFWRVGNFSHGTSVFKNILLPAEVYVPRWVSFVRSLYVKSRITVRVGLIHGAHIAFRSKPLL